MSANPLQTTASPVPAKVTVTAGNATPVIINVQQLGQDPSLIVTPDDRTILFSFTGKSATSEDIPINPTFAVASNETTWDAQSNRDWLKVTKEGNTFTLTADANNMDTPNADATVTVTGVDATPVVFTVKQATEMFLQIDPRPVTSMEVVTFNTSTKLSTVKLTFGDALEGSIETLIRYKKGSNGEVVELSVANTQNTIEVSDVGNRFNNVDDILQISTVIDAGQETIETLTKEEQLALSLASGTRIENTVYEGSPTQFTFTYVNQEKMFRLNGKDEEGKRVYESTRVADLSPARRNTSFQMIFADEQTGAVSGYYSRGENIDNPIEGNFNVDPATGNITMQYTVQNTTGDYTVNETLVPKTTPLETTVAKPFGDMRAIIPGDNNTQLNADAYGFWRLSDNEITYNTGWVALDQSSLSITIDIHQATKLTRMITWPYTSSAANINAFLYAGWNIMKYEMWGTAELDESKLQDAAYWEDADDPAGTFKEDWVDLGIHEVERLDKRDASAQEINDRGNDGNHFIIPESAGPVRYIRIYNRSDVANPAQYFLAELSFFGYAE